MAAVDPASPFAAIRQLHVEDVLLPLLWQLTIIIIAARVFAAGLRRLGQPSAIGEMLAGIVLGPSLLGAAFPGVYRALFHPTLEGVPTELFQGVLHWTLVALSQVGLVLLLFLIGLEFDFQHLRSRGASAVAISWAGILCPFVLGVLLAQALGPRVGRPEPVSFSLFLGIAMSITALPMLGRIMQELNITRSRIATVTISAGAVDDVAGWILLASIAAMARSRANGDAAVHWGESAAMLGWTVAFACGMFLAVGPWLRRWARRAVRNPQRELSLWSLSVLLAMTFGCAMLTSRIGIFAVFGAFTLGAVLSGEDVFREAVHRRMRDFVTVFFLPIFFAYTGLRTDIGSLGSLEMWGWCGVVLAVAMLGKLGGCALAARWTGSSRREAACIGIMMNTRGLMELVVVNMGKDLGFIPDSVYCMLVLMAVATTVMTTPLLMRACRGTELEPLIQASPLARSIAGGDAALDAVEPGS
ncbi:MAG: cation:proton antiporter [Planctomyces sp.]|nr:cation:proton antiporter [Planctomyces sp.]